MNRVIIMRAFAIVFFAASLAAQTIPDQYLQGLQWRLIGPFRGGRTVAAAGVPGDPNVYYTGSVGGGVWKSIDAGVTWTPIFDNQPIPSIGAIAVAPSNANVIYVGTGESDIRSALSSGDGVYKSTDAGKTWKNIGLRDSRQISKVVVDPSNADIVYVAALGHAYGPNGERGVFKSTDGGTTWKHVLDKGPEIGASDLEIAAGDPRVLFAGMWRTRRPPWSTYAPLDGPGSGLYRSVDGGETWAELTGNGLPGGEWGRVGVDVAPDGRRVY
ncbi:MAG: WD40/YVTN/BNR-like repeat-containing protein, partial [Terriglobales bacterium]